MIKRERVEGKERWMKRGRIGESKNIETRGKERYIHSEGRR